MNTWIVTGGAGFIGSHLVSDLGKMGDRIIVLDNLSSGSASNLEGCNNVELVNGDVQDARLVLDLSRNCDGIFHLAALVSIQECIMNWLDGHKINFIGTLNVYEAASTHHVPVVYASSAAVYGNPGGAKCHEAIKEVPISPYGADKLACEHQAKVYFYTKSLSSVGLRFFNIYGQRQKPSSPYAGVISRFADNLLRRRPHTIFGDGKQTRDFVFVDDAVRALKKAMKIQVPDKPVGEVCNVCTGAQTSLLEIIGIFSQLHQEFSFQPEFLPVRSGDIRYSVGDDNYMRSFLELDNMVAIEAGLKQYLSELDNTF